MKSPATAAMFRRNWSFMAAGLLALIYFVTDIIIAHHRLFWYDEIYTALFSRLPDTASIWRTLTATAADSMPPTYYMLVRAFERLPVSLAITVRLPSALALALGMLITFDCTRRLSDGLHGLIALSVLSASGIAYYGYEARPYALYFMFSSLALWLWIHTSDTSKLAGPAFGTAIFLAVTAHYYAVLCLVPYVVWEILHWDRRPASKSKLSMGCAAVGIAGAVFCREVLSMHRISSPVSWNPPQPALLAAVFDELFPYALFPLLGIMVLVATAERGKGIGPLAMQPSEQLCWFFGLIPVAGFVLAKLVTNAFYTRYFIGLLPGIAVAFSCLLWRQFRSSRWISVAALLLWATLGLGKQVLLAKHPDYVYPTKGRAETERLNTMLSLESKLPAPQTFVVLATDRLSLEAIYNSKHPQRYILLVQPSLLPNQAAIASSALNFSVRRWTMEDLQRQASGTVLVEPPQETVDSLTRTGHKATIRTYGGLQLVRIE